MASLVCALHKHVIDIDLYIPPYLWREHVINQPLISCPCVFLTKGHHLIAKQVLIGNEGGLFLINLVHLYLIIS